MTEVTFGDEAFLQLLREPDMDYETVYPIVDAAVRPFLRQRLRGREELLQELLQDVHLTVWQSLPQFLERAEDYAPQQRVGWLYAITANKLRDAFRVMAAKEQRLAILSEYLPDPGGDPEGRVLEQMDTQELQAQVDGLIRAACAMRSRPETKLAFLYNRVVMPLSTGHARKGDIQAVLLLLRNQPLGKIRANLEGDLLRVLGRRVPREVLAGLDKSLRGREEERFQLSERQIASASFSISVALAARTARGKDLCAVPATLSNDQAHGLSKFALNFDNPWAWSFYGTDKHIGERASQHTRRH